jgi:hypothetical protein
MVLKEYAERVGKTRMVNDTFAASTSDLLMVTDADTEFDEGTLAAIRDEFVDECVGAVTACRLPARSKAEPSPEISRLYLNWKRWLKDRESRSGYVIGLEGTGYAIRRALWVPVAADAQDDLISALAVLSAGKVVRQPAAARVYDDVGGGNPREFARMRRIVNRAVRSLIEHRRLWWRRDRPWLAVAVFVSKIMRWLVPVLLLAYAAVAVLYLVSIRPGIAIGVTGAAAVVCLAARMVFPGPTRRIGLLLIHTASYALGAAAGMAEALFGVRRRFW